MGKLFNFLIKKRRIIILSALIILIALFFSIERTSNRFFRIPKYELVSGFSYIFLILLWDYSIRRRIINSKLQRFVSYTAYLMALLIIVRTIKWSISELFLLEQFLWYMYYIPFILLPFFILLISLSLDENLYQKSRKFIKVLFVISIALIIFVLTNHFHQNVFTIIEWVKGADTISREWGYYLVMSYIAFLVLLSLFFIVKNSKLPRSNTRVMLPMLVIIFHVVFLFYYIKFQTSFIEMSVVVCLVFVSIIESLIQTGLIPSNSEYQRIFESLDLPILIMDEEGKSAFKSKAYFSYDNDLYNDFKDNETLILGDNKYSKKKIKKGHVLWIDDISLINQKMSKIEKINEKLLIEQEVLKNEITLEKEKLQLKQKNHLYNTIKLSTEEKTEKINSIISRGNLSRNDLIDICLTATYIKRLSNIILISELYDKVNSIELQNAIIESLSAFSLIRKSSHNNEYISFNLKPEAVKEVYTYFNEELEFFASKNCDLFVNWGLEDAMFRLDLKFSNCKSDLIESNVSNKHIKNFEKNNIIVNKSSDENSFVVSIYMPKHG